MEQSDFTCIDRPTGPVFLIDQDITFDLRYAKAKNGAHATINTFIAEDHDADIFRRLLRTRRNNRRARAYPEQPGAFA
jgi:hypothetical protein